MKSFTPGMIAIAAAAAISVPANAQTKLTFTTYVPETYSVTACETVFMDEVTRRTNGEIVFEKFYSGSLFNAPDTFPALGKGAADIGMSFPAAYNRAGYPLSNIVIPYTSNDPVASTLAFNELIAERPEFGKEFEKYNTKFLYTVITAENTAWSNKPIEKVDDLKGMRVRAILAVGDAFAKMGATVVTMAFPDAIEALSRGAIDTFSNLPFDLAVTSGVSKIAKYATEAGGMGVFSANAVAMNLDKWNSLSPEVQNIMTELAAEMPVKCWPDVVNKDIDKAVEVLSQTEGVQLLVFPAEETEKLRDTVVKELRDEWIATATAAGHDGEAIMARFLELVEKHEKESTYKTGFERFNEKHGKK